MTTGSEEDLVSRDSFLGSGPGRRSDVDEGRGVCPMDPRSTTSQEHPGKTVERPSRTSPTRTSENSRFPSSHDLSSRPQRSGTPPTSFPARPETRTHATPRPLSPTVRPASVPPSLSSALPQAAEGHPAVPRVLVECCVDVVDVDPVEVVM